MGLLQGCFSDVSYLEWSERSADHRYLRYDSYRRGLTVGVDLRPECRSTDVQGPTRLGGAQNRGVCSERKDQKQDLRQNDDSFDNTSLK